jgi:H+/Cl- antiporter ClcA
MLTKKELDSCRDQILGATAAQTVHQDEQRDKQTHRITGAIVEGSRTVIDTITGALVEGARTIIDTVTGAFAAGQVETSNRLDQLQATANDTNTRVRNIERQCTPASVVWTIVAIIIGLIVAICFTLYLGDYWVDVKQELDAAGNLVKYEEVAKPFLLRATVGTCVGGIVAIAIGWIGSKFNR